MGNPLSLVITRSVGTDQSDQSDFNTFLIVDTTLEKQQKYYVWREVL